MLFTTIDDNEEHIVESVLYWRSLGQAVVFDGEQVMFVKQISGLSYICEDKLFH
jgi:hypothetical protein